MLLSLSLIMKRKGPLVSGTVDLNLFFFKVNRSIVRDYRPISLVGSIYKIIFKVL